MRRLLVILAAVGAVAASPAMSSEPAPIRDDILLSEGGQAMTRAEIKEFVVGRQLTTTGAPRGWRTVEFFGRDGKVRSELSRVTSLAERYWFDGARLCIRKSAEIPLSRGAQRALARRNQRAAKSVECRAFFMDRSGSVFSSSNGFPILDSVHSEPLP